MACLSRFRLKYHPEDSAKRKVEQQASVQRRAEVFQELYDKGWMDKGTMDHTNGRYLIKLMDAGIFRLCRKFSDCYEVHAMDII